MKAHTEDNAERNWLSEDADACYINKEASNNIVLKATIQKNNDRGCINKRKYTCETRLRCQE